MGSIRFSFPSTRIGMQGFPGNIFGLRRVQKGRVRCNFHLFAVFVPHLHGRQFP